MTTDKMQKLNAHMHGAHAHLLLALALNNKARRNVSANIEIEYVILLTYSLQIWNGSISLLLFRRTI